MGMNVDVGGKGKKGPAPAINVTPLVDVVLVLLIIFMVVTPLLTKKMWLNVPKVDEKADNEPPPPPDAPKPVVLSVYENGDVKINADKVTLQELPTRIARALGARADRVIFFDAEDGAEYGLAVDVIDLAKGAGAQVAVLSQPVIGASASSAK